MSVSVSRLVLILAPALALVACARPDGAVAPDMAADVAVYDADAAETRPPARPATGSGVETLGAAGQRPEDLDQTSAEERRAALAPPAARTLLLGETLASLGSPAEGGLWLRTGLVTRVTQGRIEQRDGSGSLRVELRPSGAPAGAGSQLSLAAFTTLGLPLTELVSLRVYDEP